MMESRRLLVVDDSPTVRKLAELTFRETRWRIDFASTGSEALLFAKKTPPDVVLLDFVLPDMRGIDVCERLSKDERTSGIPIVVMSGNEPPADIMRRFTTISGYLPKPSTSEQIVTQVETAAARRSATKLRVAGTLSFAQKEAAAKAVFALLRDAFANIPQWMKELGDKPPATFFARKVLTPQLTGALLEALAPYLQQRTAAPESQSPSAESPLPSEVSFQGKMNGWRAGALVTFFESSGRTGLLTLRWDSKETLVYLRSGEIIAVTNRDSVEYLRGVKRSLISSAPAAAMQSASAEQRRSATPVLVTLAAAGHFPASALADTLAGQGRRLLMDAMQAGTAADFSWRDLEALPAYVEAHGRHIPTAHNTLPFGPEGAGGKASASQKVLEELRRSPPKRPVEGSAVFARAPGFSELVRTFALTPVERQVLTLVDGRIGAEDLAVSAGLEFSEVVAVLVRLAEVQLLAEARVSAARPSQPPRASRPVMILDPDIEGFQQPLASLLQGRSQPIALMDLSSEQDIVGAIRREHPQAVILNAGAAPVDSTVRALHTDPELADIALVAVLEPEMAGRTAQLTNAGFHKVLVKPIARTDIEQLFP